MQTIVSALCAREIQVDDSCLVGCIECALPGEFNDWLINWSIRENEPSINDSINSINNHVETLKAVEYKALVATAHQPSSQNLPPEATTDLTASPQDASSKSCKYWKNQVMTVRNAANSNAEEKKTMKSRSQQPTRRSA